MKQQILVTGGRGYIGSHAVLQLKDSGYDVVVVDDLSRSLPGNEIEGVKYYDIQMQDKEGMQKLLDENKIDVVMHFAAYISVHESTQKPELYFQNNTEGVKALLEVLKANGVEKFIFSSTAAVYGEGEGLPLKETDDKSPINPYGESKLQAERALYESGMDHVIFRYFNVAGADNKLRSGANLRFAPTHLINSINEVAIGNIDREFTIFGTDYETRDGTAVRDYIHVVDLVEAHIKAIDIVNRGESNTFNLGSGTGQSVKEVFDKAQATLNKEIPFEYGDRREGDPAILTANVDKAFDELG